MRRNRRIEWICLIVTVIIVVVQGCRQEGREEIFKRYTHEVFGRELTGKRVIVMDVGGCGLCNEQLLELLAEGRLHRDSTLVVAVGQKKALNVFLERVKGYEVLADSGRKIYEYFRGVEGFRLPMEVAGSKMHRVEKLPE